jgi:hypothetical protein
MRLLNGIKAITTAIASLIWPKIRASQPAPALSTSEAERLDRLRHPSKYLGK